MGDFDKIIQEYIRNLKGATMVKEKKVGKVTLKCLQIDKTKKMKYLRCTKENVFQYDLRKPLNCRPRAYRVPFLKCKEFMDEKYTVSHLCHESWCHNPKHHVLETLEDNKGRNGCPGGTNCKHKVRCIIPGPYSGGESSVCVNEELVELFSL